MNLKILVLAGVSNQYVSWIRHISSIQSLQYLTIVGPFEKDLESKQTRSSILNFVNGPVGVTLLGCSITFFSPQWNERQIQILINNLGPLWMLQRNIRDR
mmetsp:Transcript_22912/g.56948  ORF Transcript_22912/g.56948 Transcript_22912/m.56948 type:complete len:100 (-) Transcript_22912:141-440(-)